MVYHKGHRHRLKRKYKESLGENFDIHELVELLLFYSIPRKNTNEIAHRLIERFGTLERMAEAPIDELKLVDGVGDNTAILLKIILPLAKKYAEEKKEAPKRLDTIGKAVECANIYAFGAIKEMVYAVTMDNSLNVIDANVVAVGAIDEVRPIIRTVIEICLMKRATAVMLFHNHLRGGVEASSADIDFTSLLERELDIIGVHLVEHIITDGRSYNPILKNIRSVEGIRSQINIDKFYS